MLAIYKRELKSYLTSMVGYLFMFFVLLIAGIYFSAYQLSAAYPKFEYTLNAMTFVFLIAVPILTMRVLAEERKQKTDSFGLRGTIERLKIFYRKDDIYEIKSVYGVGTRITLFLPYLRRIDEGGGKTESSDRG